MKEKKKSLLIKWETSGRQEERQANKAAKKTKREVAISKAHPMDEVYKELETPEGERKIYRIAKARDKSTKDFTQIRQIKDEQGVVLWEHDKIIERWKGYYGKLLNEENPRTVFDDGVRNEGLTPAINRGGTRRNKTWKGDGTRRNSRGGMEEPRRRRGRYVAGSAPEDFRAGENARGMEGQCDCTNL